MTHQPQINNTTPLHNRYVTLWPLYGGAILPIIPRNAIIGEGSKIQGFNLGKIPGRCADVVNNIWTGQVGWQKSTTTPEEVNMWAAWPDHAVGVRSAYYPGIDVDIDDPDLVGAVVTALLTVIPVTATRTRDGSPRCILSYRLAEGETPLKKQKLWMPNDSGVIEFLGDGQQYILAGQHTSGAMQILTGSPTPITAQQLQVAQDVIIREFGATRTDPKSKRGKRKKNRGGNSNRGTDAPDKELVWSALQSIDPNLEYDEWVKVLMALHSTGEDWAFLYAKEWSKGGHDYPSDAEFEDKWSSFTSNAGDGDIGIGTLFHYARSEGWGKLTATEMFGAVASHAITPQHPVGCIKIQGGALSNNVALAIRAIGENLDDTILQRGSMLVRVAHLKEAASLHGVEVPKGSATIVPLTNPDLVFYMGVACTWQKWSPNAGENGDWVDVDPCQRTANSVINAVGRWNSVPLLTGVTESPVMHSDGTLVDIAGYDPTTSLYYEGNAPALTIPDSPTQQDALNAYKVLMLPFEEFPLVDRELDASVLLSYMLTIVQRQQIGLAPLHGFDATTPGTGKGLLVEACNLITRGRDAAIMPPIAGKYAEEETRKRITSILMQGVSSVLIDNWSEPVGGDSLNTLMTSTEWSDRILGLSKTAKLPSRVSWSATGNNLTVRGDMVRRTLLCRMDAGVENPEKRVFQNKNLTQYILQNRAALLSALFTILCAYRVAGSPAVDGIPLGRFEQWWHMVCAPIIWIGLPDPVKTQERLKQSDPEGQKLKGIIAALHVCYNGEPVTMEKMRRDITAMIPLTVLADGESPWMDLREALQEIAPEKDSFNARSVAVYLKKNNGRCVGELRLIVDSTHKRAKYYAKAI